MSAKTYINGIMVIQIW